MERTQTETGSTIVKGKSLSFELIFETYSRLSPDRFTELNGKTVLITGGGYGIGATVAESFAAAGVASILLTGRTESRLKETAERLQKSFPRTKFHTATLDIGDKASIHQLFDTMTDVPDILINNAGTMPDAQPFLETDLDDLTNCYDVNVLGTLRVTQRYLQKHRASKAESQGPAKVITMGSIAAFQYPLVGSVAYSFSKAGSLRALEIAALDYSASEACLISLHPGLVKTEMGARTQVGKGVPFTDIQLPSQFIVWLATEEAAWLHGRFVFCNWHIDDLLAAKNTIVEKDLLKTTLSM